MSQHRFHLHPEQSQLFFPRSAAFWMIFFSWAPAVAKFPTAVKAAGVMLPCIHVTLLAGWMLTGGAPDCRRNVLAVLPEAEPLCFFTKPTEAGITLWNLTTWRRAQKEKKPRSRMSSIRPSCLNCWGRTTTSTALTAEPKVSETHTPLEWKPQAPNVCAQRSTLQAPSCHS